MIRQFYKRYDSLHGHTKKGIVCVKYHKRLRVKQDLRSLKHAQKKRAKCLASSTAQTHLINEFSAADIIETCDAVMERQDARYSS
eukprot:4592659-Amphidinium_carterae.2